MVASSDKAYGEHKTLPYDESFALQGRHPYDVSKSCSDLIAQSYHTTYDLPVSITRCGNLYGGGDLNWNRIVPGTIKSLLKDEAPVIRSDGTFVRDYFFVRDAVHAYLALAEAMEDPKLCGQAFNFSNEIQLTVVELVNLIRELMDNRGLEPTPWPQERLAKTYSLSRSFLARRGRKFRTSIYPPRRPGAFLTGSRCSNSVMDFSKRYSGTKISSGSVSIQLRISLSKARRTTCVSW